MLRKLNLQSTLCRLLLGGTLLLSSKLSSASLYEENQSVRALAMGNAFSAVVNDKNALYYNPAGLNQVKGYYFSLFDIKVGINGKDVIDLVKDLRDASDISSQLDALYGKKIFVTGGGQSSFYMKNFGFTYFLNGYLEPSLTNPTFPTFDISYYNDVGYATGFSFNPSEDTAMGFSLRRINRTGGNIPIGTEVLQSLNSSDLKDQLQRTGLGYGIDFGIMQNLPTPFPSRVSFVYKNLGNTSFKATGSTTTAPDDIPSEMIFGWAMDIDLPLIRITPSFDYKHAKKSIPFGMKTHIGLEIDLPLLSLRGGLNQGYLTYGAGIGFGPLDIDVASYGVELGAFPGQKEDRRYMLELTMELGFDIDFGFSEFGNSKRRALKQRR